MPGVVIGLLRLHSCGETGQYNVPSANLALGAFNGPLSRSAVMRSVVRRGAPVWARSSAGGASAAVCVMVMGQS